MLDANMVSDLIRNPAGRVAKQIGKHGDQGLCLSIVTAAELRFGSVKSGSSRLREIVHQVLAEIEIVPFDVPADAEYAAIRADLEKVGKPIGPNDLLIASHARALGAILVTANAREFRRVRGLKVENWLA